MAWPPTKACRPRCSLLQALLPSQLPAGSALADLKKRELGVLQGKDKGKQFVPEVWDRVYQVGSNAAAMQAAVRQCFCCSCCCLKACCQLIGAGWQHQAVC